MSETEHRVYEELIPAYALGATDIEESASIQAHLRACKSCQVLLAEYRQLGDDLHWAAPTRSAPPRLEAQLRRQLARERSVEGAPAAGARRSWWSGFRLPVYAGLAAALVLLLATNLYWFSRVNRTEQQLRAQATTMVEIAVASPVDLRGTEAAPGAHGVLYYRNASQVALLQTYELPALPPDKTYQVWLIKDGQRESGGLFQVDTEGQGRLLISASRPLREYQDLGITIEPASGSAAPTSPRVMGGSL